MDLTKNAAEDSYSGFCEQCLHIFSQPNLRQEMGVNRESHPQPIHHTKESLGLSASHGCFLCAMIFQNAKKQKAWLAIEPDEPLRVTAGAESLAPFTGPQRRADLNEKPLRISNNEYSETLNILHVFGPIPNYIVTLLVLAMADNPAAKHVDRRINPENLRCDAIYKHTISILDSCQNFHGSCGQRATPLLPTRILDLEPPSRASLRLYETQHGELGDYVALSYCWGEAQPARTLQATLADYLHEIDITSLPQTIQDAIFVTRRIGYRYIWIDSLCIVQDSDEDKASEISRMTNIYNQATLTIAASKASKASEGFLGPRETICERLKLPFPCGGTGLGEVELLPTPDIHNDSTEPLNQRGWTLQERLLSPRILMFGKYEVTWQCQSSNGPVPLSKSLFSYSHNNSSLPLELFQIKLPLGLQAPPPPNPGRIQEVYWTNIVKDYSRRQLSFVEDRFNAVGGLVQLLQHAWEDQYLAGMWRSTIIHTLLWYRDSGEAETIELKTSYHAPSWSWLSVLTGVNFRFQDEVDAKYIDCSIELMSPDLPFGRVTHGKLTIYGSISPAVEALKFQSFQWIFQMDDGSDTLTAEQRASAFFILIGLVSNGPAGLVLLPKENGTYKRIGCFGIPRCPSWNAKSPFRYTAGSELTEMGKKKWTCQINRQKVVII